MTQQKNKLFLGTAQLGMTYGLHNTHGQPTTEEAFSILDAALAEGIDTFDTAYAYGTAEDVLGAWIADRSLSGKVNIISKMKPHALNDYPDGTKGSDVVHQELEKSLKRLHIDLLDGYLFHSPHYIYLEHMVEGLRKVRDAGLVKNIGVSTYDEAEALQAAELGVDYIQVPYNAFDQRLDRTDFFTTAKKHGVTVFARSPFLQGLLLMQPDQLPAHLSYVGPELERFVQIATTHQLSQIELALLFVREHCSADRIVFGVETLSQLNEDISIVGEPTPVPSAVSEIIRTFKEVNRGAINPSLWSKIKR